MRLALPLVAALASLPVAGPAALAQEAPAAPASPAAFEGPTLTVTGEGRSAAVPDRAAITLGIVAEAGSAADAMAEASASARAVIERLSGEGVAERDLQTGRISLQPRYSRPEEGHAPVIEGYEARTTLNLRVPDLDALGARLDAALSSGANGLEGLSLEVSDPEAALTEAREAAVADALDKAAVLATAAGMAPGDIVSLTEGGAVPPQPWPAMARMEMAADMPVAAGETEFTATVTLVIGLEVAE